MPLPRIFAVCDGQTLGNTTISRLIHNALPSAGSSLMCLGTSRKDYPFLDSATRSAYFDLNDPAAMLRLKDIIRNHRVVILDVATAERRLVGELLGRADLLPALDQLQARAMILTPDHVAGGAVSVTRPSFEIMSWVPSQGVVLPALPRHVSDRLKDGGISPHAALGERRVDLDPDLREDLGIWEQRCAPCLLDLLERPGAIYAPIAEAV